MYTIDSIVAAEIKLRAQDIVDQMVTKEAEIAAAGGDPVEWFDVERLEIMKRITLIAFLIRVDLACYPLSASAVIFFP